MDIKKININFKFLIFIPLLIYFGKRSLIAYDEGFYAIQSRLILAKGNWIAPIWWDKIINDRTIGIQFLLALSRNIFGGSIFALYIPILIASIIMLYATYHIHKELLNDKYSFYSPLILCTTYLWITYANMATQDIVFASIISCGILGSIKAYKTNQNIYFLISGIWIGLAVMLKTYLTVIPLIAIIPFLLTSKIIYKKYFWLGCLIGFLPFLIWSYKYISIYGYTTYSGIYRKLITLSETNTFTKTTYYYLWNLTLNIFPWSILSLIGFLQSFKMKSMKRYFLFFYPIFSIVLLSSFSTKTPYYPLPLLSLISINSFLGIKYIIDKGDKKIISYLDKLNYIFFPSIFLLLILIINLTSIISIEFRAQLFITIGVILFSCSWITYSIVKNKKVKLYLSIIGPYFLIIMLVQSGLITDKSKDLRIASDELIKIEKLSNTPISIVKPSYGDNNINSKIIKIMTQMPKLGNLIDDIDELNSNNYAWTTSSVDNLEKFNIVNSNKVFYPWKLIIKK